MKKLKLKVKEEKNILISNKSFLDFSNEVFEEVYWENQLSKAPIEVQMFFAETMGVLTSRLFTKLFGSDSDIDLEVEE